MKTKYLIVFIFTVLLLSACTVALQESAVQTAVSEVIATSSAAGAQNEGQSNPQVEGNIAGPSQAELDEVQQQLTEAQIQLTSQAGLVAALQAELQSAQLSLTPQPTNTPTITPTPTASATPTAIITPGDQKAVVAVRNAPLWTFKDKNDAGKPIMYKPEPVTRYEPGEEFVVKTGVISADGGGRFYLVVGPKGAGYYVSVDHVSDK